MPSPIEILANKVVISSSRSTKEWAQQPIAERQGAFFSAENENARLMQRIQTFLVECLSGETDKIKLPNGEVREVKRVQGKSHFIEKVRDFMDKEGISKPGQYNKENDVVTNIGSRARLSLIFDVQTRSAYSRARFEKSMTIDALRACPAARFVRYPGAKTMRPIHVFYEDEVRLKTDFNFWAYEMNSYDIGGFLVPWAPYGFNSYMDQQDVDRGEAMSLGLIPKGWEPTLPDLSQFGVTMPDRANAGLSVSTKGLPASLKDRLKKKLKERYGSDAIDGSGKLSFPSREALDRAKKEAERIEKEKQLEFKENNGIVVGTNLVDIAIHNAGIDLKKDATLNQIGELVNSIKYDHGITNSDVLGEVLGFPKKRGFLTEDKARKTLDEFLKFVHPEILNSLPKCGLYYGGTPAYGEYDFKERSIRINSSPSIFGNNIEKARSTIFHEFTHWVHINSSPLNQKMVADYFRYRTEGESMGGLKWGGKGYTDDFPTSFEPTDDYAGRYYGGGVEEGDRIGVEFPTRHLQRLSLPPEDLMRYFNDKSPKTGKYSWREAFVTCLKLLNP